MDFVFTFGTTYVLPFVAFFIGTFVSTKLDGLRERSPLEIWLMSIPVSIFVVGLSMMSYAVPEIGPGSNSFINPYSYAYTSSIHQLLVFYGFMMFSGTIVPYLYQKFQEDIRARYEQGS